MKNTVSGMILTLLLVGSLTLVFDIRPTRAEPNTEVYLVPSEIKLNTSEVSVGSRFNVAAWVSNVTDLFGWQIALYYNTSILNMTSPAIMEYFDSWGRGLVFGLLSSFNGTKELFVFEFEIMALPSQDQNLTSPLIINPENNPPGGSFETKLVDSSAALIPFTATDGVFEYSCGSPLSHTLTIHSSPVGVTCKIFHAYHSTPWSGTFCGDTSVSLTMPATHIAGDTRYRWDQWSDGNTSRSRAVTVTTNTTMTAYFAGPYNLADVNFDGIVNILDGVIIAVAFGSQPGDPRWNPLADLNEDGIINIQDVLLWATNFGKTA